MARPGNRLVLEVRNLVVDLKVLSEARRHPKETYLVKGVMYNKCHLRIIRCLKSLGQEVGRHFSTHSLKQD